MSIIRDWIVSGSCACALISTICMEWVDLAPRLSQGSDNPIHWVSMDHWKLRNCTTVDREFFAIKFFRRCVGGKN